MGEANTMMTLEFESPEEAAQYESRVAWVVDHLNDLYDSWQGSRGWGPGNVEDFLSQAQGKFREALEQMGLLQKVLDDPNNGLAFTISMPGKDYTEFGRHDRWITWGGMTSHLVNWSYNAKAFRAAKIPAKITWHAHDLCCDGG